MLDNVVAKYLTVSQAAKILKVSSGTLRRWDKAGKFESQRHPINNYRVYSEQQVLRLTQEIELEKTTTGREPKHIKPIFQSNYGSLYNSDVLDFFKIIPSNTVDLIFADPPYNIKKAVWDTFSSQKDYVNWCLEWIVESHRVLKNTGSIYVCGFSEILADIKWASTHLFKGCKWLIWFYRNKANLGNDWGRSHESILHFRKSKRFVFNIDEARIPYNQHTLRYPERPQSETSQYSNGNGKKYIWNPHPLGAKPKDVFEIPTISNSSWEKKYNHETQKPVELLKRIILSSSNDDSIIVDPFGGSGTTYAVSEAFRRNWLGNDNNLEYCKMIVSRITDEEHIHRIESGVDEKKALERRVKLRG